MKTWIVVYKDKGVTHSSVIKAKTFDDAVYEVWELFNKYDVKAILEVAG